MFQLHENFSKKIYIKDLQLCKILLEPTVQIPWIILVPKLENKKNILDLNSEKQMQLQKEINLVGNLMKKIFNFDQINIATIGNITQQLHIHIIARFKTDFLWPDVVWNKKIKTLPKEEVLEFYKIFAEELRKI